jgi:hypothetical protein
MAFERMDVHDPVFNIREIVKQMVLLEDHLTHKYKVCPDCIRKHLLTIEALAEEATCLDTGDLFHGGTEAIASASRNWMEFFLDQGNPRTLADQVRQVRKSLCPFVADPREKSEKLTERYLQSQNPCPHG